MTTTVRDKYLVFGRPEIGEEEIAEVVDTLRSGWLGTGPKVARFEEMFRDYTGAGYAQAVSSCTAALHLSMVGLNIGPGDEVITTPMTFAATANSILHTGAVPVFVDIDPDTQLIDVSRIEEYLATCQPDAAGTPVHPVSGRRVRAILPVHLTGRACDMTALTALAEKYRLHVIEDAAHAIETVAQGNKVGSIGDLSCFSFYVTKNLVTAEGGMVTTDDEELAQRIKINSLHGMTTDAWKRYSALGTRPYDVVACGFKYNMTDIQAALGIHQIQRLPESLKRRQTVWQAYDVAFADLPVDTPAPVPEGDVHARHLYTLLVDRERAGLSRDEFRERLHELNIGTGIHYTALNLHSYYQETLGCREGQFPRAEYVSDRTVSLPLSAGLSDDDVEDVIQAVRSVLSA